MVKYRARAGPPTLAGRLRLIRDDLQALAGRLREAIAGAVAGAAAAVHDALRLLLGAPEPPRRLAPREDEEGHYEDGGWDELDDGLWGDEGADPEPPRQRDGPAPAGRALLRAAVGAALCWLRRLPGRRPALAAALLGAAACAAALAARSEEHTSE